MTGNTITLKEVLERMDTGEPFSIRFCTASHKTGKGGVWVDIDKATKTEWLTAAERRKQARLQPASQPIKKNPNHYPNSTRNIHITINGEIRKLKIRLIRRFNGMIVP